MSDTSSDIYVENPEWPMYPFLKSYEGSRKPQSETEDFGDIVFVRLINKRGQKMLARAYAGHIEYDKSRSPFKDQKVPFYNGAILQYMPLNAPMSYLSMPDIEDDGSPFKRIPSKLQDNKDYLSGSFLSEHVLLSFGDPSEENPFTKSLIFRYTDPQGVVWKIRHYPKIPKGQTKPVLAWTNQYNKSGKDVDDVLEGDFYNEVVDLIQKFQATRTRRKPDMSELTPVAMYTPGLATYFDDVPEVLDDGETVYNAYRLKDDLSGRERNKGKFYAISKDSPNPKIVGPTSKFDYLAADARTMKSQGKMVIDSLMGATGSRDGDLTMNFSDDEEGPKGSQASAWEGYLPWIGLGLGTITVGTLIYVATSRRR